MATPNTPLPISPESQAAVVQYLQSATDLYCTSYNIRNQLMMRDRAYYREEDWTEEQIRAKMANRTGDSRKTQNVTVPVVMPQTESALANYVNVFLTGYPIFGTTAPPDQADALAQFDAVVSDNSLKFGWPSELMKTIRNGLKYDLGACEVTWERKKIFSIGTPQLDDLSNGSTTEELYQGNRIKDIDPYNLILDTRVSPDKNHIDGEYAGYTELHSRIKTKMLMDDLDKQFTMNYKAAFESGTGAYTTSASDNAFFIPMINPDALLPVEQRMDHDWMRWASLPGAKTRSANSIAYHNSYEWTVLYARIIPSDFGMRVQSPNTIQIWKFIIINRQVVIYAERQTNAHNMLPIIVCKPSNDGMGYQSKSFAENVIPIQQASTALFNSGIASQRRKVYDRLFYDPTRVRKQDIDKVDPVSRIPVKSAQLGKGLEGAVLRMDYSDNGVADIMQMSQQIVSMGEIVNGQNRVQMGQFQKGNKTRREFDTVMSNSNSRTQMGAIGLEYTFWLPIKEIVKANVLQYQPPTTLMGRSADGQDAASVKVDPQALRQAMLTFNLSDGLMNSEKLASTDLVNNVLQAATVVPTIAQEYDISGILEYTWDIAGIHWVRNFKRTPEQQQEFLQRAANQRDAEGPRQKPQQQTPDAGAQGAV